jgi:hypothetical protein
MASAEGGLLRNVEVDWGRFEPNSYWRRNYRDLRADDRQILQHTRDHFAAHRPGPGAAGLDVGPGPNLYPSLAMLPFCARLDLLEYAPANVRWLRRRAASPWWRLDRDWQPFWAVCTEHEAYAAHAGDHPLRQFAGKAVIEQGSVFDLAEARWDLGTMFFVACSMSTEREEFFAAVRCFLRALRPGAPFAAAFMTGSDGFEIGGVRFPAVAVDLPMIERALAGLTADAKVVPIRDTEPLRSGVGMALALGLRGGLGPPRRPAGWGTMQVP